MSEELKLYAKKGDIFFLSIVNEKIKLTLKVKYLIINRTVRDLWFDRITMTVLMSPLACRRVSMLCSH